MQPVGNGGSQHAENGNAYALAFNDKVRVDIGLASLRIDDICTEGGAVEFLDPFVVNLVTNLHVVITECLGVVLQVVDDFSGNIGFVGGHKISIIAGGLTL